MVKAEKHPRDGEQVGAIGAGADAHLLMGVLVFGVCPALPICHWKPGISHGIEIQGHCRSDWWYEKEFDDGKRILNRRSHQDVD